MRLSPLSNLGPRLLDFSVSDTEKRMQLGTLMDATGTDYDTTANVANWGLCQLVYVSSVQAAAILPGTVCVIDKNFRAAPTAAAATEANTGKGVFIAVTNFAVGSTTEQYGWVLRSGVCPARFTVAATAGRVFAGAAGVFTPTAAAGVQILNAETIIAAASTFTRVGRTQVASSLVQFSSTAGMYPGQAISGTGIPASSVISSVLPDGNAVEIGSAIGTLVTATASGNATLTMTNTGYGIIRVTAPFVQGQIT
jgi:hypothetical protein